MGQTPADSAPTPAGMPTPGGWGSGGNYGSAATPGGYNAAPLDSSDSPSTYNLFFFKLVSEMSFAALDKDWLFDNAVMPYHRRIKVEVEGTKSTHYYGGEFEGWRGRISAGTKAPSGFEQTCTVQFERGEARSFPTRFLAPVHPTAIDEEVLVLAGTQKGQVMVVRDRDDDMFTVSTKAEPGKVVEVHKEHLVSLYDEQQP